MIVLVLWLQQASLLARVDSNAICVRACLISQQESEILLREGRLLQREQPRRALIQYLQPAAIMGHPCAQGEVSWAHIAGVGVPLGFQDLGLAFYMASQGHARGSWVATAALGWCHYHGIKGHAEASESTGISLWTEAASHDEPHALVRRTFFL